MPFRHIRHIKSSKTIRHTQKDTIEIAADLLKKKLVNRQQMSNSVSQSMLISVLLVKSDGEEEGGQNGRRDGFGG